MILIQYVGFESKASNREYAYRVVDPLAGTREIVFTISNQAFLEKLVRYQDGPEVCYLKLRRELEAESTEAPLRKRSAVSDAELGEYRATHRPAKR